jgi:hypothetical protein
MAWDAFQLHVHIPFTSQRHIPYQSEGRVMIRCEARLSGIEFAAMAQLVWLRDQTLTSWRSFE